MIMWQLIDLIIYNHPQLNKILGSNFELLINPVWDTQHIYALDAVIIRVMYRKVDFKYIQFTRQFIILFDR